MFLSSEQIIIKQQLKCQTCCEIQIIFMNLFLFNSIYFYLTLYKTKKIQLQCPFLRDDRISLRAKLNSCLCSRMKREPMLYGSEGLLPRGGVFCWVPPPKKNDEKALVRRIELRSICLCFGVVFFCGESDFVYLLGG